MHYNRKCLLNKCINLVFKTELTASASFISLSTLFDWDKHLLMGIIAAQTCKKLVTLGVVATTMGCLIALLLVTCFRGGGMLCGIVFFNV